MSSTLDWSDSRKHSRFTTGGGPAVVAVPESKLRHLLWQIKLSTSSQLASIEDCAESGGADGAIVGEASLVGVQRSAARKRLNEIDAALNRIADGSYGVCHGCGRPVPYARLKACPETRFCLSCDNRQPKNHFPDGGSPPRSTYRSSEERLQRHLQPCPGVG